MENRPEKKDGPRERKRRETLHRIAESGLNLFLAQGYEETTLDAVAAAAGISRRTFFHYFKSKEDILLAWQAGIGEVIGAGIRAAPPEEKPLHLVRDVLIRLAGRYQSDEIVAIDRVMRCSEALQARKQGSYVQQEADVFAALQEVFPQAERASLRVVAMVSIGSLRLAFESWSAEPEDRRRPLAEHLREMFVRLEGVV
jgi:AcrR family transcriptional regulator